MKGKKQQQKGHISQIYENCIKIEGNENKIGRDREGCAFAGCQSVLPQSVSTSNQRNNPMKIK